MPHSSIRLPRLRRAGWLLGAALLTAPMMAPPAIAQSAEDIRIRKLEQEVRALQRKVFPGADGRYFEPEVTAPTPAPGAVPANTGGPVTDLLARMDAVEAALQRLTAQTEVNQNALNLLNARVETLEANRTAAAQEPRYAEDLAETPAPSGNNASGNSNATSANMDAMTGGASSGGSGASAGGATVEKPSTGDAGDDAYVYGFRLWDAGRYAEARSVLEAMVKSYPKHRRASWARNLIGRSYLDQKQYRPAAEAFLANYLENRDGERAPDSLVYLAQATAALGNNAKACEALEEFRLVYPGEAANRLSSLSQQVATRAKCN
ncbi:tetratricopeptide repeat protein [uncultured Croceicoccus sp.]|uniref:tetratricopeptide repeat protein n=1 Tax=uncultured Croceicoccus sp. TaxID=1295329 RepID=UPI00262A47CA|nr:tetratricopeptide repeat protein [uncultured Croceicoccus sp.]